MITRLGSSAWKKIRALKLWSVIRCTFGSLQRKYIPIRIASDLVKCFLEPDFELLAPPSIALFASVQASGYGNDLTI
jgi:hypothetical protein